MFIPIKNNYLLAQLLLLLLVVQFSLSVYAQYNDQQNAIKVDGDFSALLMETQYETANWEIDNISVEVMSPQNSNYPKNFAMEPTSLVKDNLFLELLTPPPENPHYCNS